MWKELTQKTAEKEKASEPPPVTNTIKPSNKYSKNSKRRITLNRLLTRMIVEDFLPISIVERDAFKEFIKELDPLYIPPSRDTLTKKLIPKMFDKETDQAKSNLSSARYVSITTDAWTSNATDA